MPIQGLVQNVPNTSYTDGVNPFALQGKAGELVVTELRGKYAVANYRGRLFNANVTAVTVPVVASGLVSVFSIWNPPSSGVMAEMVDTEIGQVLATTVVDAIGWYMSSGSLALAGTFTTKGTPISGIAGNTVANQVLFYSAYTHSGTPARQDIIGSFGAVTDAGMTLPGKIYDGRFFVPPGSVISVAMSTAAGTTSGLDVSARWIEWPI